MTGFTSIPPENLTWITHEYLNQALDESEQLTISNITERWALMHTKAVSKYLKNSPPTLLIVLAEGAAAAASRPYFFSIAGGTATDGNIVLLLLGQFRQARAEYTAILLVIGDEATLLSVKEAALHSGTRGRIVQSEDMEQTRAPEKPIQQNLTIGMPDYTAYIATEGNLLKLLRMAHHDQVTKILSTIISLYPYTKDSLAGRVDILYFAGDKAEEQQIAAPPGVQMTEPDQGESLTTIGLFLLGMAYSNPTRFPEQVTRRLRAVAATLGSNAPDRRIVDGVIQTCHWQTEDQATIVDDALGYMICFTKQGSPDPEAPLTSLMDMNLLQREYGLSPAAVALLDQARLVYLHYHATSINFISQVLPALSEGGHQSNAYLATDILACGTIAQRVATAPFLGLRGQLPESFQIRSMPALVYCALLYYQASLETEEERRNFNEYKIADIRNHVHPKEAQSFIETLVGTLPKPSTTTIADLVATLPLEKANILMAGRDQLTNQTIYEILKSRPNPGAWAQERLEREDGEFIARMVGEVRGLLKKKLQEKTEHEARIIRTIEDPIEQRAAYRDSATWASRIEQLIEGLAPLESQLSQARTQGQKIIKANIVSSMKEISREIDNRQLTM